MNTTASWPLASRADVDEPSLFNPRTIPVADPHVAQAEHPRLGPKSKAILDRLRAGPATNVELAGIGGLRWHGRVFDLRQAGFRIVLTEQNCVTGRCVYALRE